MKKITRIRHQLENIIALVVLVALLYLTLTDGKYYIFAVCIVGFALITYIIALSIIWRCPYCKKHLPYENYNYEFCPHCGRTL